MRTYVLYVTTLTMVVAAIAVVFFESRNPNSNIKTFSSALWWTAETVSTVGYGDYYPVTWGGRIVAGVLFVNGVAPPLGHNGRAGTELPLPTMRGPPTRRPPRRSRVRPRSRRERPVRRATSPTRKAPTRVDHVSENPQELEKVISELERAVSSVGRR